MRRALERRRPGGRRGGVLAASHERRRDAGAPAGEDAGAPSLVKLKANCS